MTDVQCTDCGGDLDYEEAYVTTSSKTTNVEWRCKSCEEAEWGIGVDENCRGSKNVLDELRKDGLIK